MDDSIKIRLVRSDRKELNIGTGYDWQLSYDADVLDGFGSVENDITIVDNAVGDGGIVSTTRLGSKDRIVKAFNSAAKNNDVIRKTALSFLSPKYKYKMYVTYNGVTRWAECYLAKFKLSTVNIRRVMDMLITFTFPNPYWNSEDNFGKDIAEVTGKLAFPYICAAAGYGVAEGVTGGTFSFADVIQFENDGDTDTYCRAVITANGDVTNPKLVINDNYVRIIDQMEAGDEIVLDFTANPPTVKKNGENWLGHCDRTSAFDGMRLPVGISNVSYDADNGSSLMAVSLYYNKLYGAI